MKHSFCEDWEFPRHKTAFARTGSLHDTGQRPLARGCRCQNSKPSACPIPAGRYRCTMPLLPITSWAAATASGCGCRRCRLRPGCLSGSMEPPIRRWCGSTAGAGCAPAVCPVRWSRPSGGGVGQRQGCRAAPGRLYRLCSGDHRPCRPGG